MIRLLLIRHATNDLLGRVLYGRTPGVHLNEEGIRQAQCLAQALARRYVLSEVISSPLDRAIETADPIAELQNLSLTIDDKITEIDVGSWMGESFSELHDRQEWRDFNRRRSISWPPDGESMMDVQSRAWRCLTQVTAKYRDQDATVAMVTHGDVVRCLLMLLLGMPIDFIHRLEVSPASLSEIQVAGHFITIFSINQTFYDRT
jgi:broad specificity phosphatase PhoE